MNKLCQQYISNVKSLFPIMGKDEKKYVHSLATDVNDYCSEESIETIDELYENYGAPSDIVNNYFSASDTTEIIKRIKISRYVKKAITALLLIAVITAAIWGFTTYSTYQTFMKEQAVFTDTIIE